ncbi:MAG: glycosyltransferase [Alphaproteobacteria bacterium]|nr:glycosyltransferase [Alphaproteobacteria bacterium]
MRILIVAQDALGRFLPLTRALNRRGHDVAIITHAQQALRFPPTIRVETYPLSDEAKRDVLHLMRGMVRAFGFAMEAAGAAKRLRQDGWLPDVVFGSDHRGELMLMRDVFPAARILVGLFPLPGIPSDMPDISIDDRIEAIVTGAPSLLTLEACDGAFAGSQFERRCFPRPFHDLIDIIPHGVDTEAFKPNPTAVLPLPDGGQLKAGDAVVGYVVPHLEPCRRFPDFMRMVPELQKRRPEVHVVVAGGDNVTVGRWLRDQTYRQALYEELETVVDWERVHFVGMPARDLRQAVYGVSQCMLCLSDPVAQPDTIQEVLASGCAVLASTSGPYDDFVGVGAAEPLDSRDPETMAEATLELLSDAQKREALKQCARENAATTLDLNRVVIPRQTAFIEKSDGGGPA